MLLSTEAWQQPCSPPKLKNNFKQLAMQIPVRARSHCTAIHPAMLVSHVVLLLLLPDQSQHAYLCHGYVV